MPASPRAPDEATSERRSAAELHSALHDLPESQSVVLERAYMRGQSLREIADDLDVPLGTVKSRVRLAMRRLRVVLEPG